MESLLAPLINLGVLVAFLAVKMRKPLAEYVRTRHQTVKLDLDTVANQLKDAQIRFNEYSAKLKAVDAELAAVREQGRRDAQQIRARIVQESERLAKQTLIDAKDSAEAMGTGLRSSLYAQFGLKIVDRAERLLRERLTGDDRVRIRKAFSREMEGAR